MATLGGDIASVQNGGIVVRPVEGSHPWATTEGKRFRRSYWTGATPEQVPPYPRHKPLPYLMEARLITRAQQGDIEARNRVWETHLRLAVSAVNRYSVPLPVLHDVVQEAAIGLHRAIAKFEIERYNAFSTYAWWWVSQHAHRSIPEIIYPARVPAQHLAELRAFRRWWESTDSFGRRLPMPEKHRERWKQYGRKLLRICRVCFPEQLGHTRPDIREHDDPFDLACRSERDAILHAAIDRLDDRERIILTARFGLDGQPERTLEAVAETLDITRERVRQVQKKAVRRLRYILQQWPARDPEEGAEPAPPSPWFIDDLFA